MLLCASKGYNFPVPNTPNRPYTVVFSARAVEDLLLKVRTERVKSDLRRVAEVALDDHCPPDGGVVREHGTVYWRRGLTTERRHELNRAETRGTDCDDGTREQAYNFVFVYRRRGALGGGWYIIMLLHIGEFGAGIGRR
ncbi:MAG: hypothetical protein JWO67_1318 [Streptosporangiaceae bacterium]|nr:hypothetical protein [Streptosporangiaceae bacterium]